LTNSDYSKHKIEFILKKLHLPVSESNLSFVERLDHIPFDIHPELIVHIYYNDENEKAKKKATKCGGYSLSRPFRERHNQAEKKELKISNYDYDTFYNQLEEANVNEYWRKSKKICIGHINEVYIQDILLWEMAKKYYESCNQNLPTILKTKNKNQLCVQNYNNQVFNYKIRDENNKDENNRDISIKMQFFQLDDFLFSESKKDLSLIIQSHINRKRRERSEDNITNNQSYTLNELKEEKRNVFFEAMRFLKNTLNWEKGQIRPVTRELLKKHSNEFKCKASTIEYLSFYTVCIISKPAFHKLYSIMEEIKTEKEILVIQPGDASVISKLKELQNERKKMSDTISDKEYNDYDCLIKKIINARNHALHTNIPSDDVYYKLMKETSVLDFLGVVE